MRSESPLYKRGEVVDLDTGECVDISKIDKLKHLYIGELFTTEEINRQLKYKEKKENVNTLEAKYRNKTISKDDMLDYLGILGQKNLKPNYNYGKGYIIVNLNKLPNHISKSDFWAFYNLLKLLSDHHTNRLIHGNGRMISRENIKNYLGYKSNQTLKDFFSRMRKAKLIKEVEYGYVDYLMINPAYAMKNMKVDRSTYLAFKDDLDECLTEEQIYYLNMQDDAVEIEGLVPICD